MFQLKRYIKPLALTLSLLGLWSCQDSDTPLPDDNVPEGMTKLTILIPDYEGGAAAFGTRALNEAEEGYMSNLYIIAVKYKNYVYDQAGNYTGKEDVDPHTVYPFALNPIGEKFQLGKDGTTDYHAFNVTLSPGEYRFGVVANVDLYLDRVTKISEFTQENELDNIVLNFTDNTPLAPPHLPMVCMPPNLEYRPYINTDSNGKKNYGEKVSVKNVENNLIPIPKDGSPIIYAHMNFLCSKVRYTILFDKTPDGISKAFGSSWIRFNVDDTRKPFATKMRRQTQLITGTSTGGTENPYDEDEPFIMNMSNSNIEAEWLMGIGRYYWSGPEWKNRDVSHGNEGANYPLSPKSKLDPYEGSTADWIPMEQKVWQGIVYLPENNGSTESGSNRTIASTELHFPYHTRINSLDDTPEVEASEPKVISLFASNYDKFEGSNYSGNYSTDKDGTFTGLERNYFYDVVAQVINPDVPEMDIKVFVSIIPWHEIDQNISDDGGQTSQEEEGQLATKVNFWNFNGFDSKW